MKTIIALIVCVFVSSYGMSQTLKWSTLIDTSTTFSSPRGVDLTNDGVLDIVIGGGLDGQPQSNGVNALNGVDGSILWNFHTNEEIFGSAKFMDISGDGIDDVFIGGRYAEFYAIDGSTGNMIWEFFPYPPTVSVDSGWFNFYNPQFIPDQNSDGVDDILVANGGDHAAPAWDTLREPGMLMVLDAMTGNVLAKDTMPDGEETYCAPTVVDYNGQLHIIYGSGGENDKGALWRVTLADLMADSLENSTMLVSDPSLGFIAPSSIADMNDDGVLDIINQAYDGTMRCFNGTDNSLIWQVNNPGTESSAGPTIGNFIGDATPDVFGVVYKGAAPSFTEFYQILIDGANGNVAWKDSLGSMHYGSSSAVDLDLNGRDEAIVSLNYHNGVSFSHQILSIDFQNDLVTPMYVQEPGVNLAVTPMIEDLDGNGNLDFIFAYRADSINPMAQNGFYVKCLEGTNTVPGVGVAWGNYQGTEKDGHYTYTGANCGTLTVSPSFQNISCNDSADASASVIPTGGIPPFSYLWSTGDITNSIDSMDVGTYSVIVTDSTGCYNELSFNAYDPFNITFGGIVEPVCPGDSNGLASVNSSGCPCMFSGCQFNWASGDNTKNASALTSGWQTVEIVHLNGCVVLDSVLVPESTPVLDSVTIGNILCASDPYASSFIQLFLNNPVNTSTLWSTSDSTTYIDSLDVGLYYVNLHDSIRGCSHSDSMMITTPDTLLVNITSSNLQCYGDSSGSISAIVTGGYPNYNFNWSNGDSLAMISNLDAGYYDLTVVDSVGCTVFEDNIVITQPAELVVDVINYWNDSTGTCAGGAVGICAGGTSPYTMVWNDPMTTGNDTVIDLCDGVYTFTVTDDSGCVSIDSIAILNTLSVDGLQQTMRAIYPNPTAGIVTLEGTWIAGEEFTVKDNTGRLVLRGVIESEKHEIDLSTFDHGLYFIELSRSKTVFKIVKD